MDRYGQLLNLLRQFGDELTDTQREALQVIHDNLGFMCNSHSEGQDCCVDYILEGS